MRDYNHPVVITNNWKYFYLMPTKISNAYFAMSEHTNLQVGDLIEYALISYAAKNKNLDVEGLWVSDDGN